MYSMTLSTALLRQINPKLLRDSPRNVLVKGQCRFYRKYSGYGRRLEDWFSEQSIHVVKACTRQFEFIAAQRVRRSLQLFNLYSKIWDEVTLKEFIKSWRRRVGRNTKEFLFSAVGVTMFNWDRERITDDEFYSYAEEIDGILRLRDSSVVCVKCHRRLVIDQQQQNVKYCTCHGSKPSYATVNPGSGWQPFIEREDMIIWRKEEEHSGGLYAYKVFGSFSDVSAEEFLQVQVDVDYRKTWDPTARELKIIDTDPKSISARNHRTDVIYWEMIWPTLFSNRDYVYQRRWVVDEEKGVILILSRVTDHPDAPSKPNTYRVKSYWSCMVIKPSTNFKEPGIEFSLTYFDDPGINIPSAITAWVAMSGLPDFLIRMRQAAKGYGKFICSNEDTTSLETKKVSANEENKERIPIIIESSESSEKLTAKLAPHLNIAKESSGEESSREANIPTATKSEIEIENYGDKDISVEQSVDKERSYFRYLFLTRLFA